MKKQLTELEDKPHRRYLKLAKKSLENLAYMNIILALSTTLASSIVFILLEKPIIWQPLIIIFFVTFAGYTFNRFTDKEDIISHPKRTVYIRYHGGILFMIALFSYVCAIIIASSANSITLLITLLPGVAIAMYSIEWIPNIQYFKGKNGKHEVDEACKGDVVVLKEEAAEDNPILKLCISRKREYEIKIPGFVTLKLGVEPFDKKPEIQKKKTIKDISIESEEVEVKEVVIDIPRKKVEEDKKFARIKEIHAVKNIFVAFIWSITVIMLPLSYIKIESYAAPYMIWIFFFGRFLVNTTIFDMKDIEGDTKHNIPTIPVRLGLDATIVLLSSINIITFLIIAVGTLAGLVTPLMHIPNTFAVLFTAGYLYLSYKDQKFTKRWYNPAGRNIHFICDVLVDGEYIAMAIPLYIYLTTIMHPVTSIIGG